MREEDVGLRRPTSSLGDPSLPAMPPQPLGVLLSACESTGMGLQRAAASAPHACRRPPRGWPLGTQQRESGWRAACLHAGPVVGRTGAASETSQPSGHEERNTHVDTLRRIACIVAVSLVVSLTPIRLARRPLALPSSIAASGSLHETPTPLQGQERQGPLVLDSVRMVRRRSAGSARPPACPRPGACKGQAE